MYQFLSSKIGTNFVNKRRSLVRYSLSVDSGQGVFCCCFSRGEPTKGGLKASGLGVGLTTPRLKKRASYEISQRSSGLGGLIDIRPKLRKMHMRPSEVCT
jgi:hypothetical protein